MLKIVLIGDTHLGYHAQGREQDPFQNALNATELIKQEAPDLILLMGDIFDLRLPRQETYSEAIIFFKKLQECLTNKPIKILKHIKYNSGTKPAGLDEWSSSRGETLGTKGKTQTKKIISIYGTHEKRNSELNPITLMDQAGFLTNLHAEGLLLQIEKEKIGLFGLSGVPENYFVDILKKWNPQPFENEFNILLIHQSFKEYIPEEDIASISDMPKGFNYIFNGHIHWHDRKNNFILTGSLGLTQLKKIEEKQKGFIVLELEGKKSNIRFIPVNTRKFYNMQTQVDNKTPTDIFKEIIETANKKLGEHSHPDPRLPILNFRLIGTLRAGFSTIDLNTKKIKEEFQNKAIINFNFSKTEKEDLSYKFSFEDIKSKTLSIQDLTIKTLLSLMEIKDEQFISKIFNYLKEGELEEAKKVILEQTDAKHSASPPQLPDASTHKEFAL